MPVHRRPRPGGTLVPGVGQGARADDAALADLHLVKDRGAHADDAQIADRAAVQRHRMPTVTRLPTTVAEAIVGHVYDGVVLDRRLAANPNMEDVATDHGSEPRLTVDRYEHRQ